MDVSVVHSDQLHVAEVRVVDDTKDVVMKHAMDSFGRMDTLRLRLSKEEVDEVDIVRVELWDGMIEDLVSDQNPSFLRLRGEVRIDMKQWKKDGACRTRFYQVESHDPHEVSTCPEDSKFLSSNSHIDPTRLYFQVKLDRLRQKQHQPKQTSNKDVEQAYASDFHFVLPNRNVKYSRPFQRTQASEIFTKNQVERLHDLLPAVLYGKTTDDNMNKRLSRSRLLLQFACQYTSYCTHSLETYSINLDARLHKLRDRKQYLQDKRRRLRLNLESYRQQLDTITSSLSTLQKLCNQVDPSLPSDTLACTFCSISNE